MNAFTDSFVVQKEALVRALIIPDLHAYKTVKYNKMYGQLYRIVVEIFV
jgi:hypothetical protein